MKDVKLTPCVELPETNNKPKIISHIDLLNDKGCLTTYDSKKNGLVGCGFNFTGTGLLLNGKVLIKDLTWDRHIVEFTDRDIYKALTAMSVDGEHICWLSDEVLEGSNCTIEVTGD